MNQRENPLIILAIESSCDDTSAAVLNNRTVLSNIISSQQIHAKFGGVVPELASRSHQINIVPVISAAILNSCMSLDQIDAIAYTQGPGLLGSLLVGGSFAKGLSMSLNKPLIEVNHMHAHILAHFIENETKKYPNFPFLSLTVSGGHTEIVLVESTSVFKIIGKTLDDAAGEAFDKVSKILGLPYPGGPLIDNYSLSGNADAFQFPKSSVKNYDYSFSGFKTSFLNFINKKASQEKDFIKYNLNDICSSAQKWIITTLMEKLCKASEDFNINEIAISGGVSANSSLRNTLIETGKSRGWNIYLPPKEYCTDNAAMIGIAGYFKYLNGEFATNLSYPKARITD